jgi:hypothetical protein
MIMSEPKQFEIYFRDLTKEAQERFKDEIGDPEACNFEFMPLAVYESEEEVEADGQIDFDGLDDFEDFDDYDEEDYL